MNECTHAYTHVYRPSPTEAEGLRFGERNGKGIGIYNINPPQTTDHDMVAFGFMTYSSKGTLLRLDSADKKDFTEFKLVRFFFLLVRGHLFFCNFFIVFRLSFFNFLSFFSSYSIFYEFFCFSLFFCFSIFCVGSVWFFHHPHPIIVSPAFQPPPPSFS